MSRTRIFHKARRVGLEASAQSIQAWDLVERLRETEGSAVTIVADNGDFTGPNSAIVCSGDWTDWKDEQFTGDTALEALRNAYAEMKRRAS